MAHHRESSVLPPTEKRRSSTPSPVPIMTGGNDDLLTEILLRLPAKTLIRSQLVSRHWRSLITHDYFTRLHVLSPHRRPERHHSFILGLGMGNKLQYFICDPAVKGLVRLRFPLESQFVNVLQSCNGLLLLGHGNCAPYYKKYCIFNPVTMKCWDLNITEYNVSLCLIFDPSLSPYYRVVRFDVRGDSVFFSLYDSATHRWTAYGESSRDRLKFSAGGLTFNNRIYFIKNCRPSFYFSPEENLCKAPMTPNRRVAGSKSYAVESNGHLHYLHMSLMPSNPRLYVSEMIGNKWRRCKGVDLRKLKATFGADFSKKKVELLGMVREERLENSMFLFHVPGRLLIYRFSGKMLCEVVDDFRSHYFYNEDQLQFSFKDAHTFIQNFAPV